MGLYRLAVGNAALVRLIEWPGGTICCLLIRSCDLSHRAKEIVQLARRVDSECQQDHGRVSSAVRVRKNLNSMG
jgi:hypothetical protein